MQLGSLLIVGSIAMTSPSDSDVSPAMNNALKASYMNSGIDKYIRKLEKKLIPKDVKTYGSWLYTTFKIVSEKRITYEFTF